MEHSVVSTPSISRKPNSKISRRVSMLTPCQLARKRANDREAQRAIRTRTKQHIEQLEHEVQVLKDRQINTHTIQDLLHRNAALEAELDDLRATLCLASNMSLMPRTPTWTDNAPVPRDTVAVSCQPVPLPGFLLPPADATSPGPLSEVVAGSDTSLSDGYASSPQFTSLKAYFCRNFQPF